MLRVQVLHVLTCNTKKCQPRMSFTPATCSHETIIVPWCNMLFIIKILVTIAFFLTFGKPVPGGVSEWSAWNACEKPCGISNMTRTRSCTNPEPKYGGSNCYDTLEEKSLCEFPPCPGNNSLMK